MSSVIFYKLANENVLDLTFDGTVYASINSKQTYGSSNTTIDIEINYSADVAVDHIAILGITQTTGLTFDLDFKNSSGASIGTESISQTVETYPRTTAHQILSFTELSPRKIEIQITGITGDIAIAGIFPFLKFIQPSYNYQNGATLDLATERNIMQSQTFSYARHSSKLREFNLPFVLLADSDISKLHQFDALAGDYPILVRTDPSSDSAENWMVANWNIGTTTTGAFNDVAANLIELRAWL
ncbi:hypothetical protein OAA08_00965 [bacterium]|nr:hypothetical protein [bacterium]